MSCVQSGKKVASERERVNDITESFNTFVLFLIKLKAAFIIAVDDVVFVAESYYASKPWNEKCSRS